MSLARMSSSVPEKMFARCYALGDREVTAARCTGLNSNPKNQLLCTGCESPFRECRVCIEKHTINESSRVKDPKKGLCGFHIDHGVDAIPPLSHAHGQKRLSAPADHRDAPARRMSGSAPHNPRSTNTVPDIVLEEYISTHALEDMARKARRQFTNLTKKQEDILKGFSQHIRVADLQRELNLSQNYLSMTTSKLNERLMMPSFERVDQKVRTHLKRLILGRVYKMYMEWKASN